MTEAAHPPDRLPGELIMWVLIISEMAVFGAALLIFLTLRLRDPEGFAAAQDHLHRLSAGLNTVVLVTSGFGAACAVRAARAGQAHRSSSPPRFARRMRRARSISGRKVRSAQRTATTTTASTTMRMSSSGMLPSLAAAAAPSSDTATPPPPGDPETGASRVGGSTEPRDGMRQITW